MVQPIQGSAAWYLITISSVKRKRSPSQSSTNLRELREEVGASVTGKKIPCKNVPKRKGRKTDQARDTESSSGTSQDLASPMKKRVASSSPRKAAVSKAKGVKIQKEYASNHLPCSLNL